MSDDSGRPEIKTVDLTGEKRPSFRGTRKTSQVSFEEAISQLDLSDASTQNLPEYVLRKLRRRSSGSFRNIAELSLRRKSQPSPSNDIIEENESQTEDPGSRASHNVQFDDEIHWKTEEGDNSRKRKWSVFMYVERSLGILCCILWLKVIGK